MFNSKCRTTNRRGMLLLELMISLGITAMLLTAIAGAYQVSSNAIQVNSDFFSATQAARVSMNQMLNEIRRCDSCQPSGWDTVSTNWTSTALGINGHVAGTDRTSAANQYTETYQYAAAPTSALQYVYKKATDPNPAKTYSLGKNVTALSFSTDFEPDPQSQSHALRPVRITVDMTVTVGAQSIRMTGSAVPRLTVLYK